MSDPGNPQPSSLTTRWSMLSRMASDDAETAWTWFVDRYRPLIGAVLRRHLGPDADAAEPGFWGFFYQSEAVSRADRNRSFRAFLRGVTRNYAKKWRHENAGRASGGDPDRIARADTDLPEDEEVRLWSRHLVAVALQSLRTRHPDCADVLEWFYGIGADGSVTEPVPVAEIAQRRACNTNAIHQTLFRGRQRLRQALERELREVTTPDGFDDEIAVMLGAIGAERPGLIE